jgi:hypothetical protein
MLQITLPTSVPNTATAVVLNVTAVAPTAAGFLTVLPGAETLPTGTSLVSNLNFAAGQTVANEVTVAVANGDIEVYNSAGYTDVVVDLEGYYTTSEGSSGLYNAMSPTRVLGTLAIGQAVGANSVTPVQVAGGSTGVPATATAVVVNVTAAWATLPSFLTVYPYNTTKPLASNLNFGTQAPLQAIANRVTVGVDPTTGDIDVYNLQGTVNVDVDLDGYYTGTGGTGSQFYAITPQRLTDTRIAENGTPIAASTSETFALNTTASGIPTTAAAVAANFTVVPGAAPGYLTVYPTSAATNPVASDVNWTASESPGVPNFTIADTASTGNVAVFNSHGATINLLIDAFGYFGPSTAGAPSMVSATVTKAAITITYNEPVSCVTATSADFAYDYNGTVTGGTATGCSTSGDLLTLTTGSAGFTLPSSSAAVIKYTAPVDRAISVNNTTGNAVYAVSNPTLFAATGLVYPPESAVTAPAMVSAYATATTLVITYNEDVTCPTGNAAQLALDFAYDWTGTASGLAGTLTCTAGAAGTDQLTLTETGTGAAVIAPAADASITYTAPPDQTTAVANNATVSVSATGNVPLVYAATQKLSVWTTPTMTGAVVTAGVSGTGTILVTYGTDTVMTCPGAGSNTVQAEFAYSNGGTTAYPSTCAAGTTSSQLLLGTFYTTKTGTAPVTLVASAATDTLTYTAPTAANTTTNAVHDTVNFPQFAATQTFGMGTVPTMVSAVVNASTIVITFNEAVSCPTTFTNDWTYNSTTQPGAVVGGIVTGCTAAGDVLTLSATGGFNAATGTASIVYAQPSPTTANAVYSTVNSAVFEAGETLPGSDIS